jgi:hypothetical protein
MGGGEEPVIKEGNGPLMNRAPTRRELEFWAGNIIIPAPGIPSRPQEAVAT